MRLDKRRKLGEKSNLSFWSFLCDKNQKSFFMRCWVEAKAAAAQHIRNGLMHR